MKGLIQVDTFWSGMTRLNVDVEIIIFVDLILPLYSVQIIFLLSLFAFSVWDKTPHEYSGFLNAGLGKKH